MITKPISTSISRVVSIAINDPDGSGFNPLSLFSAGEQGAWYDPSDLSTLFQDAAGTIPVTAAGQPVGKMLDKSGRGNHATQATATARPVLQTASGLWYLAFDGVDDSMATGSIDFTAQDKLTLWVGMTKLSDTQAGIVCELSANLNTNAGTFFLVAPDALGADSDFKFKCRGSINPAPISSGPYLAPSTKVVTGIGDIAADRSILRLNGTQVTDLSVDHGSGNLGNYPLYIGRRGAATLTFHGNMYGLIVRGVKSTDTVINQTEIWMNSKTGAY